MDDPNVHSRFPAANIFCNDRILHTFQLAKWRPHPDSKTLVDRPLKMHPDNVLQLFNRLPDEPSESEGITFLNTVFQDHPDDDRQIVHHKPSDFTENPPSFTDKYDKCLPLRNFATNLKHRWVFLCRKFAEINYFPPSATTDVSRHPHRRLIADPTSSLIPLPHPFFVPGGRFRECYYWDTLWIIHGLLASDMLDSAKNAIRNLLYLVNDLGFVPNGNRVYYLNRSQPPILPEAVLAVFDSIPTDEGKREWLLETLPTLEKEYSAFMECRVAADKPGHTYAPLAVYRVNTTTPRPESYSEDMTTAAAAVLHKTVSETNLRGMADDDLSDAVHDIASGHLRTKKVSRVYQDLASGAESGWDFSSRWLGDREKGLPSIRTSKVIPACLNSVLLRNEDLLRSFHVFLARTGGDATAAARVAHRSHTESAAKYARAFARRQDAMQRLLWSASRGMWMDYDMSRDAQTGSVSVAGLMPVWGGAYRGRWGARDARRFVATVMQRSGLVQPGGVAATSVPSEEQWDFPNCWTPLVDFVVSGLNRLAADFPGCGAAEAAEEIAMRTMRAVYRGWDGTTDMHEKYDATDVDGRRGEGGEYEPQDGFGWTNGVALKLMREYAPQIAAAAPGDWLAKKRALAPTLPV